MIFAALRVWLDRRLGGPPPCVNCPPVVRLPIRHRIAVSYYARKGNR